MILFCKDRAKIVWMWQDTLKLPKICLAQSSDLFLLNRFGKWAELRDGFWKGEIVRRVWNISLEGSWGREMGKPLLGKWRVGSDIRSYSAVVKEACCLQFLPFPKHAGKIH